MIRGAEYFKEQLLEMGIKDEGCHHGFTNGTHGEKLEFGIIVPGSREWKMWVALNARMIRLKHDGPVSPLLVSLADGTIELTDAVAAELNAHGNYETEVLVAHTQKTKDADGNKQVNLSEAAKELIGYYRPESAEEIDDAATSGSTTAMPVSELWGLGVSEVSVLYTWLRKPELPYLDELRVPYRGIIDNHPLPDFSPADCALNGFCADPTNTFIPYGQKPVDILEV